MVFVGYVHQYLLCWLGGGKCQDGKLWWDGDWKQDCKRKPCTMHTEDVYANRQWQKWGTDVHDSDEHSHRSWGWPDKHTLKKEDIRRDSTNIWQPRDISRHWRGTHSYVTITRVHHGFGSALDWRPTWLSVARELCRTGWGRTDVFVGGIQRARHVQRDNVWWVRMVVEAGRQHFFKLSCNFLVILGERVREMCGPRRPPEGCHPALLEFFLDQGSR